MGSAAITKQRILNAAERMFGIYGFDGTTLRNIVNEAEVNLALVSYHFGSKEELYQAVVTRMVQPIIERQLAALAQVDSSDELPSLDAVLNAYIKPSIDYLLSNNPYAVERANFFARYYMEPQSVQELVQREFAPSDARFLDILQRVLPDQSRMKLVWKLDAVTIMLVGAMTQIGKPGSLIKSHSHADIEAATLELVAFAAAGMRGAP